MKNRTYSYIEFLYYAFCFTIFFTRHIKAYVDPSIMTYTIQAIAGIAISLGTVISVYWRKLNRNIPRNVASKVVESDDLYFNDPESGTTVRALDSTGFSEQVSLQIVPNQKKGIKNHLIELNPGFLLSLASSFMICIFAPLDFYFHNIYEFNFDIYHFLPELIKLFILLFVFICLILIVCYLINNKLYSAVLIFGFITYFCTYIQGNFLVGNLPVMDGTRIDWSSYRTDKIVSLILWIFVTLIVILIVKYLNKKRGIKLLATVSSFITAVLLATLLVVSAQNNGSITKSAISTKDNEYVMSDKENFIILVLDMYDSMTFDRIINDVHPQFREYLNDFTYFPDTVSAYGYTKHAIPQMLTGKWYENDINFQRYSKDSMMNSELFKKLSDNGYEMSLYEVSINYDEDYGKIFNNIQDVPFEFDSFPVFAVNILKLTWFRYAPYSLKGIIDVQIEDINELRKKTKQATSFIDSDSDFYNDLLSAQVTIDDNNKVFKFIHIQGAHMPYTYDENMNAIPVEEGTYEKMAAAMLTLTDKYLSLLKENGVYDNSNIIILSDHGYQKDLDTEKYYYARSNPILMIKTKNEHHELLYDNAPISYDDLMTCYLRIIDGYGVADLFDAKEGDQRLRRYLGYDGPEGYDKMIECFQSGKAWEMETMIESGNVYYAE